MKYSDRVSLFCLNEHEAKVKLHTVISVNCRSAAAGGGGELALVYRVTKLSGMQKKSPQQQ